MNPENPYAAPQTLDRTMPWAEALPAAAESERVHYPEVPTVELQRLANWSVAIDSMSLIWAVTLCFTALATCMSSGRNPYQWYWAMAMGLAGVRLWGDYRRTSAYWGYNLILDGLFCGSVAVVLLSLASFDWLALLIVGMPTSVFGLLAGMSVFAHLLAKPLYGKFTHRELLREVRYRRQNRIA